MVEKCSLIPQFLLQLFYRGQPELKEKVATCFGLIGGILGNEAGRYNIMRLLCPDKLYCKPMFMLHLSGGV